MRRKGEWVMEKLQGFTDHVMLYVKTLVKWLLAAALIGTVGGAVGSLFHLGVEYATELRTEVPVLLYALPLAGVLIVALYRFLRTQGVGTNAVLDAVHQGRERQRRDARSGKRGYCCRRGGRRLQRRGARTQKQGRGQQQQR